MVGSLVCNRARYTVQQPHRVGCGEGSIDLLIQAAPPGLMIRRIDVLVSPEDRIPVETFDRYQLPFDDKRVDTVMFVGVAPPYIQTIRWCSREKRTGCPARDRPNRPRWGSIPGRGLLYSKGACTSLPNRPFNRGIKDVRFRRSHGP
jgi:hypothetical protein